MTYFVLADRPDLEARTDELVLRLKTVPVSSDYKTVLRGLLECAVRDGYVARIADPPTVTPSGIDWGKDTAIAAKSFCWRHNLRGIRKEDVFSLLTLAYTRGYRCDMLDDDEPSEPTKIDFDAALADIFDAIDYAPVVASSTRNYSGSIVNLSFDTGL